MKRFSSSGACLAGSGIQILLYADDIVLISDTLEGLQRQHSHATRHWRQSITWRHISQPAHVPWTISWNIWHDWLQSPLFSQESRVQPFSWKRFSHFYVRTKCRRLIRSLIHLTYTRPDLFNSVSFLAIFNCTLSSLPSSHLCSSIISKHNW